MSEYIGKLIPCPKDVVESCCIKIVGDQSNCQPNRFQSKCNWELLAIEWDCNRDCKIGEAFAVKRKEVEQWMKIYSTASYGLNNF